ncbi:protein DOS2-like [Pyrus communis]|uniref:protein DOS2-like n=1 Tax=Pyrus communis TaxID=23211 RepID=UPI0035C21B6D
MNFFNSVFSDEPLHSDDPHYDAPNDGVDPNPVSDPEPELSPRPNSGTGAWSFGGLITTLATKSGSVMKNYRRDLEEFGSELKKETAVIREVASRAVKDLPGSLEVGASVAQESLETVGQAIDDIGGTVWKSTAEIISHGRDAISADVDVESDNLDDNVSGNRESSGDNKRLSSSGSDLRKYSRFDAQVRAVQSNLNTYLEEPEDLESYGSWKLGFVLDEKVEEVENLMRENGGLGEIYAEIVPGKVDSESFWSRYFYRVHKLKEAEEARAKLVNRAILGEEEDLSWDFDDDGDDDKDKDVGKEEGDGSDMKVGSSVELEKQRQASCEGAAREGDNVESVEDAARESVSSDGGDKAESKSDEVSEGKTDGGDSCKESDVSIVSSQPSMPEEEDLGWDEIEDLGSIDESKGDATGSSANRANLHKRLSAAEEEEDLSWDIEDDEDDGAIKS